MNTQNKAEAIADKYYQEDLCPEVYKELLEDIKAYGDQRALEVVKEFKRQAWERFDYIDISDPKYKCEEDLMREVLGPRPKPQNKPLDHNTMSPFITEYNALISKQKAEFNDLISRAQSVIVGALEEEE